jgi:hypothetical protein
MDAVATHERREEHRVPFASRVMIVRRDAAWFAQVLDISPSGCGVFRPDGCVLLEDEIVRLFFYRDGEPAAAIVPARVARVSDTRIGVEYHEPQRVPPVHRS